MSTFSHSVRILTSIGAHKKTIQRIYWGCVGNCSNKYLSCIQNDVFYHTVYASFLYPNRMMQNSVVVFSFFCAKSNGMDSKHAKSCKKSESRHVQARPDLSTGGSGVQGLSSGCPGARNCPVAVQESRTCPMAVQEHKSFLPNNVFLSSFAEFTSPFLLTNAKPFWDLPFWGRSGHAIWSKLRSVFLFKQLKPFGSRSFISNSFRRHSVYLFHRIQKLKHANEFENHSI